MNNVEEMITKEIKLTKLRMHLLYISGILLGCICLVVILSFCENSLFQNCLSVSSTVTSIILSVIAIILSVTGERTTNEIRNKVSDSVNQLEDCTEKSSQLTDELTKTIQQMNLLYKNMNEKIVEQLPQMQSTLNDLVLQNKGSYGGQESENAVDHIVRFFEAINPNTKNLIKKAYIFFESEAKKHPITMGDVMLHLMKEGADVNTANLVIGLMLGNLCTGALTSDNKMKELIERL